MVAIGRPRMRAAGVPCGQVRTVERGASVRRRRGSTQARDPDSRIRRLGWVPNVQTTDPLLDGRRWWRIRSRPPRSVNTPKKCIREILGYRCRTALARLSRRAVRSASRRSRVLRQRQKHNGRERHRHARCAGRVAVVGIGETEYYKSWPPRPTAEFKLAAEARSSPPVEDAGHRSAPKSTVSRFLQRRPQRGLAPGGGARHRPAPIQRDAVGRRVAAAAARLVANGAAAIHAGMGPDCVVAVPLARPGPVRPLRPGPCGAGDQRASAPT